MFLDRVVTWAPGSRPRRKMADSASLTAKRCDSGPTSSVSMETISSLTELEDLERVYQQLCVQEVRVTTVNGMFV